MSNTFRFPVQSLGTRDFLDTLAQNASTAINAIPGVPAIGSRRFLITAARLVAVENLDFQFSFFASSAGATADVDTNRFISQIEFLQGMGYQRNGAGLYYYYLDGLAVPYYTDGAGNAVGTSTLNVSLTNKSAAAKTAGALGAINLEVWLQPMDTL